MRMPIFVVSGAGDLTEMRPSAPPSEDALQELVARYPKLISGETDDLLLIRREFGIGDSVEFASRWSIDHLFVTKSGIPVLVEVKRAGDTRLRREVVGQMLDYAANSVEYWPENTVSASFASHRETQELADEELRAFLGPEARPDAFWQQVDANFKAGRVRMVFVADSIPSELARIIEFMNQQMTASVQGIELRYFEAADGSRTLAPRVVGELARSGNQQSSEPTISEEEFIARHFEGLRPNEAKQVTGLIAKMSSITDSQGVASTNGAIYFRVDNLENGQHAYVVGVGATGHVEIWFRWVSKYLSDEQRRDFLNKFEAVVGKLSTSNIGGFPRFDAKKPLTERQLDAVYDVLEDYVQAVRMSLNTPSH